MGDNFEFSLLAKGDVGSKFASLQYNLSGEKPIAVTSVKGELIEGHWEVLSIIVKTPENMITVISKDINI